jgi:HEPN pEK499 p136
MLIAIDNILKAVEQMLRSTHRRELDPARCLSEIELQLRLLSFKLEDTPEIQIGHEAFLSAAKAYLDGPSYHRSDDRLRNANYSKAFQSLRHLRDVLENARMPYASRNEAEEFAKRTKRNLEYIEDGLKSGAQVHVVTQIVLSMLGLIVFPWERSFAEQVRRISLEELIQNGWPKWTISLGVQETVTLGHLLRHLRNGIGHGRITFSSDSPYPGQVIVEFEDYKPRAAAPYWRAHISAANLRDFCVRFANLIEAVVG